MPLDKKPIDIVLEYVIQLKILIQNQDKEINDMKQSIKILSEAIADEHEDRKKGWIF
tara:strand:- start:3421 stop:3591 length:171 start_codon:yes stop_codon:yes gene_type:complete